MILTFYFPNPWVRMSFLWRLEYSPPLIKSQLQVTLEDGTRIQENVSQSIIRPTRNYYRYIRLVIERITYNV